MDVKRFAESRVGRQLLDLVENEVRREFRQEFEGGDLHAERSKIAKLLGFDPLGGIEKVVVYGGSLPFDGGDDPIDEDEIIEGLAMTGVAVITLTGTTGNLEGLALATPEYQSEQYHGATIHSGVLPEIPPTAYMAVHKPGGDGANSVVFGLHEGMVKQALDRLIGRDDTTNTAGASKRQVVDPVPGEYFAASVRIDEQTIRRIGIPEQQSAVFRMIQGLWVSVGEGSDSLLVQLAVDVVNEQRAEQIQQLLQGLLAFIELPLIEDLNDEEFLLLQEFKDIEVTRSGSRIACRLQKPVDIVMKRLMSFLEEL